MKPFRVVAFESGPAYVSAGVVRSLDRVVASRHGRGSGVDAANVFAGVSAGSWNALFLASHERPSEALDDLQIFWENTVDALRSGRSRNPVSAMLSLTGQMPLLSSDRLRDYFISVFGPNTRLGDLKHHVVVPAFQVDGLDARGKRSWADHVFHNLGQSRDLEERVVDVALRSGAAPVELPLFQSITGTGRVYTDGGLVANNPCALALARIAASLSEEDRELSLGRAISMLSLGVSMPDQFIEVAPSNGVVNWGYGQWVLDPHHPLRLLDVSMAAGTMSQKYVARQILGEDAFQTLDPLLSVQLPVAPVSSSQLREIVAKELELPETRRGIAETARWLSRSGTGWYAEPEHKPKPKPKPRTTRAAKAKTGG